MTALPQTPARRAAPSTPRPTAGAAPRHATRRAEAPAPRRLRAVPAARPRRQVVPTWLYTMVACAITIGGIIGIVALNALAAEASFEARALESEISDLTLRHDELVATVAQLEAPERVRRVAEEELGLIQPEQPGFLVLDPDDLVPDDPKPPVHLDDQLRLLAGE